MIVKIRKNIDYKNPKTPYNINAKTQIEPPIVPTVPKGSNNKNYQCHDQHIQVLYLYQHFQLDVIVWYCKRSGLHTINTTNYTIWYQSK